jgi:hypothetical protein
VSAQPPPPPPGYVPVVYRDPHDYYTVGQDDRPGYLYAPSRDNPQAITAFSFGISALGLFVLSGGIAFLISIPCSIVAMVMGRRGAAAVDSGVATLHRRYARAAFWMGVSTCGLASFMGLSLILAAIFPDEFDNGDSEFTVLPFVAAVARFVRFATGS